MGFAVFPLRRRQRADGPLSLPLSCPVFPSSSGSQTRYTEVITIDEHKQAPEIGTPEAAVQSCVNLLAKVTNIPENKLAYYLDMYYQLRDAYEAAKAEERLEARRTEEAILSTFCRSSACPEPAHTMSTPAATAEVPGMDTSGQEEAETDTGGEGSFVPDALNGFDPVEIKHSGAAAQAAAEKRRIKARLDNLRAAGMSLKRIVKAANGNITEDQIRKIIDCEKMPIAVYRVLDGALDTLEGPALDAQRMP